MGGEAANVTSPAMRRAIQQAQLAQVKTASMVPSLTSEPAAGSDITALLSGLPKAVVAGVGALLAGSGVGAALAVGGSALLGSGVIGLGGGENLDVAVPGGDITDTVGVGGLQFPWETPSGEGFIAPWTDQIVFPSGRVGVRGQIYPGDMGSIDGSLVVYYWTAGQTTFWRLQDGRVACWNGKGVLKTWKPKKHIVIPRNMANMRLGRVIKVERMLDKYLSYAAKKSKRLKLSH